jgi:glycosyltransferase involved in cell wall biosynthesis
MSNIILLTGNTLCHNPRVIKEATALTVAGHTVEVLGVWIDLGLKAQDLALMAGLPFQFTPVLDATRDRWLWLKSRLRVRMAREWHQRTGRETNWQLGYSTGALWWAAQQRVAKTDLFIAHSEPALWAVAQVLRGQRTTDNGTRGQEVSGQKSEVSGPHCRVGVDMEDWFSEDLTPEARNQRPIKLLKRLERGVLSGGSHSTCTSKAMSKALSEEYGCRPPTVVYNAFPWADRLKLDGQFKDRTDRVVPSLHWYSQTLGAGRGLEDLFAALPQVQYPLQIHLRGKPVAGFDSWLQQQLPEKWRSRVFVHALVSNDELLSRIAEHDIGFAGEMKYCRSRDLTATNKILHYLLAALAVVASDTAGQTEIAAQASNAVQIYPAGDASALAQRLNFWLEQPKQLANAKVAALQAAEKTFCWERQVPVLLESVGNAFSNNQ